jgi:hypothetical protein
MKKSISILVLSLITLFAKADEGMWLLMHIKKMNHADMQSKGLKLTAEQIYDVNNSSLKDAIVSLGGFCTGEIVSSQGLMLTNHHCAFDAIQSHSTVDHDYLTDGFWAKTKADELPVPGLYASFLVRMEDVTDAVLSGVKNDMSETDREAIIKKNSSKIQKDAVGGTEYTTELKSFYDGNEYYLFVYEVFNDVRLVGAPPSAIGKFGGDTDNWMWPRQTGDFGMFRVYSNKSNQPAEYSKDNVPYKPKHHLPISLNGVEEGDYAMIMGYPGSTDRYLSSYGVKSAIEKDQPSRVKIRAKRLELMKEDMDKSDAVRIQYASNYAQVSNYWKYFIGQTRGLKRLDVFDKKKAEEDAFMKWVNADADRKKKYGSVINDISDAYTGMDKVVLPNVYLNECILGIELNTLFLKIIYPYLILQQEGVDDATKKEQAKAQFESVRADVDEYFKNHNAVTDQKIMAAMLEMYYKDIDPVYHTKELIEIQKKNKGDFKKFVEAYYKKSIFTDKARLEKFMLNPDLKTFQKDQGFTMFWGFIMLWQGTLVTESEPYETKLSTATRLYVEGIRLMNPDKAYSPNANSTMRLTYGNVLTYKPQDGLMADFYTTIDGIMEKEDPKNDEFIVPAKLKSLWEKKDYGQYADENGNLRVGFISNTDITGGNSGSPVINGKGELIGTAFDGNWEAMSGDIAFEPNLQRTISVDIRYTLFIIDKFAGAKHLIDEMTIVKDDSRAKEKKEAMEKYLALIDLGDAEYDHKHWSEAKAMYQVALEVKPGDEYATRKLAEVEAKLKNATENTDIKITPKGVNTSRSNVKAQK